MKATFSVQALWAGVLAAFAGFASSFAIIVRGLTAVGATEAEAASGLMALSIAMGLCAIIVSLKTRLPISIAWSTPGAALLATTGAVEGGFPAAAGAFLICALLIILAGLWTPLGRAVARIPAPLANAMLAGVLLSLCLAPVKAVAGLALTGAFGSALMGAVAEPRDREAAVATFLVSASGLSFLGIGGAFWGLATGGAMMALGRWRV